MLKSIAATLALSVLGVAGAAMPASADFPGQHPYYVHALSDLHEAFSLIDVNDYRRGVDGNEDAALDRVVAAIRAIKIAGIDDGKDIRWHAPVSGNIDRRGRLLNAEIALRDARSDIVREEQNPNALSARHVAHAEIDSALRFVKRARFDNLHHF